MKLQLALTLIWSSMALIALSGGQDRKGQERGEEERNVQTVATLCHQGSCCHGDIRCHAEPTIPGEAPARQHLLHDISLQRQQQGEAIDKERVIERTENNWRKTETNKERRRERDGEILKQRARTSQLYSYEVTLHDNRFSNSKDFWGFPSYVPISVY